MKPRLIMMAILLAPTSTIAQTTIAPSSPEATAAPISAPISRNAVLRTGTEVPLKLAEELTTKGKKLRVGQRVRMVCAEAVLVEGIVVIPVGSPAIGEITDVRNKGMWGKSGHFTVQILYVTVNGRQIRLSGVFDDKGTAGGVGAVAVSAIVFVPAGFFMTGTSAKLPLGTPVVGFVNEDVVLSFVTQAPPPLQVPAPAPPVTVPVQPVAASIPVASPAPTAVPATPAVGSPPSTP